MILAQNLESRIRSTPLRYFVAQRVAWVYYQTEAENVTVKNKAEEESILIDMTIAQSKNQLGFDHPFSVSHMSLSLRGYLSLNPSRTIYLARYCKRHRLLSRNLTDRYVYTRAGTAIGAMQNRVLASRGNIYRSQMLYSIIRLATRLSLEDLRDRQDHSHESYKFKERCR